MVFQNFLLNLNLIKHNIMNNYKKFIKEAHKEVCQEWKDKIEEAFPEDFKKTKLEVGKWYWAEENARTDKTYLFCYQGKGGSYGWGWIYWSNSLCNGGSGLLDKQILATDKEVEEMLIKEAKKRGFKKGVKVISPLCDKKETCSGSMRITSEGGLWDEPKVFHLFTDGKWATIIEEPLELTVEEISKKYGREVKIVK